ncbi:hypothetical protein DY000_02052330 [Brassica cretica]|uniref:Xylanase inhibitor N-terminal domain-containing protein n=1 Tax=Brassica cretica TaxID=69181 RepID=A0ABQ7AKG9_BRACR|nr:hypothetical protein DY000_02052330 [Brassica cretica]
MYTEETRLHPVHSLTRKKQATTYLPASSMAWSEGELSIRDLYGDPYNQPINNQCVTAGNTNAIYYEGLYAALIVGPEKCIRILQPNVPNHDLSTLAVGIFNVCIGNDKEASKLFQQFEANHYDLRSDAIVGLGADLEWRLISFGAPYMNRYGASFKFPDDEVIKSPSCLYGHDYTVDFEGSCKNCRLFWICCNISHIL